MNKKKIICQFNPAHTILEKEGRQTKFCLECCAFTGWPLKRELRPRASLRREFELSFDGQKLDTGAPEQRLA